MLLWSGRTHRSLYFSIAELDAAAERAAQVGKSENVFFGVGLRRADLGPFRAGAEADVCAVPGLWLDVDFGRDGHSSRELPPTFEDALQLVNRFPLKPTLVIHSGHGIQAYWLFKETWSFDTEDERRGARALLRSFQATVRSMAQDRRWHVDDTSDLRRVFRPPGSWNRKTGLSPVPVRIIEFHDDRRYEPADFEFFVSDVPDDTPSPWKFTCKFPSAEIKPIVKICSWLRHCRDDAARLDEPSWFAMLSILGRCVDGERLAHEWSRPYPRYRHRETSKKVHRALASGGPRTCAHIRYQLGGEKFCRMCPAWQLVKSPISIGVLEPDEELDAVTVRPDGIRTVAAKESPSWQS